MPAAETLRQTASFAALLSDIQHRVQHLEVAQTHIPTLHRQRALIRSYCASVISIFS
jgi:hypothetical protein